MIENLEQENVRLRLEVEMLTLARQTLTSEFRTVYDENKRLKQVIDADSKYVCENKPMCNMKG